MKPLYLLTSTDTKINDKETINTFNDYSEARKAAKIFVEFKEFKNSKRKLSKKFAYKEISPDIWSANNHVVAIELKTINEKITPNRVVKKTLQRKQELKLIR